MLTMILSFMIQIYGEQDMKIKNKVQMKIQMLNGLTEILGQVDYMLKYMNWQKKIIKKCLMPEWHLNKQE